MRTIPRLLLLSILFLLACSLTTPPTVSNMDVQAVNKIYLATPTVILTPVFHTIPAACTVSAESLHLRDCAGLHCSVIAWLSKGEVLEIQETDQDWIKVTSPAGQIGWVHSKYCGGMP